MKLLFDLFPIILFFIAYKTYDIFVATGVAIVASLVQTLWHWWREGAIEKTHVITFVMLLLFGGLTIMLRDPVFLMWKVSIINLLFAVAFLASHFIGKKNLIERMLGGKLELPKEAWSKLNFMWSALFIVIALINAYFVNIAIVARDNFFAVYQAGIKESLNQLDCSVNISPNLCLLAQEAEATWVNFKLFGTMGLTIVFVIFTGFFLKNHLKE